VDAVTAWFEAAAPAYARGGLGRATQAWEARAVMAMVGGVPPRALELGCGSGAYTRRLRAAGASEVVAVDRAPAMVAAAAGPGVRGVVADAAELALGEVFDLVLCAGMLEFVDRPERVLARAADHLAAAGRVVLFVPRPGLGGRAYQAWHAGHGVPVRLFDEAAVDALARGAGLRVTASRRVLPFGLAARLERAP
jgi:SAM-dependent methyltransferase